MQEKGLIRYDDLPLLTKDGRQLSVEFISNVYAVGSKRVIQCTIRDITEQKRAAAQLSASEANLAKSQQMAHLGSWELDLTNPDDITANTLRWSEELFRIFGYDPQQIRVSNEAFFSAVHPEDRDALLELMSQAIAGARPYEVDHRIILPSGEERFIHAQSEIIHDAKTGQPLKMVGLGQDITERKRNEIAAALLTAQVAQERQRFLGIVATIPGVVWESWPAFNGVKHHTDFVSDYVTTLLGYGVAEWTATPNFWLAIMHPEDRERAAQEQAAIFASGEGGSLEFRWMAQSGAVVWVQARIIVIQDEEGLPIGLRGVTIDVSKGKKAEETLRSSEARFRTMIQSSWDVFHLVNPDGSIIYESPAVTRVLGYLPEDMVGHNVAEFVHPEDIARIMEESFLHPNLPGALRTSVLRIRHQNGSWRWVESFEVNLIDNPDVGAIAVNYRDITERREAEAQRDRFFTLSLDILGIAGLDGYFKRVNPAFLEILGYSEAEMLSRPMMDFVHPEDHAATKAKMVLQAEGEPVLRFENRYRTKGGEWRWFEWKGVTASEDGLIYAAARDVTERRESEIALRQMRDELEIRVQERTLELARAKDESYLRQTILEAQGEASIDGILIVDPQGKIVSFNRRFTEMWGISEAVMAEKLDAAALDAVASKLQDPGSFRAEVAHLYRHREERSQEEILLVDGRTFDRYSAPVKGTGGTNEGRIWFFRDVTERKQIEESIHHAREEAESARESAENANRAKSDFLSRMSHELRTPLNAILGFGQILDQQELGLLERESVDYILKGGRHLLGLINEILDLARVEAGHTDLSLEPIAIADLVAECCSLVRPLAEQSYIRIVNSVMGNSHVIADHQRLKQVLINLLSNAIKYNRAAGSVTISVVAIAGEKIQLRVHDSGFGLTAQEIGKLFMPFERLNAENSQIEGTGLGLVLSQQLVKAMNGALGVESTIGEGSVFWIELPEADCPADTNMAPSNIPHLMKPLGVRGRAYTVLSIEDNLSNVRLLEVILGGHPEVTLLIAMQGSIGLDLARQHSPDVILLDLHMPGISGGEVLQQLKQSEETQDTPVIIVSADATPKQIDRLLEAGAVAYLTKPIDMGALLKQLDEIFLSQSG